MCAPGLRLSPVMVSVMCLPGCFVNKLPEVRYGVKWKSPGHNGDLAARCSDYELCDVLTLYKGVELAYIWLSVFEA